MGPDPPDGASPEQLPAQGRAASRQEAATAEGGGEMAISSAGGINIGDRLQGYRGLHHEESEYSPAIYCDSTDSGPL